MTPTTATDRITVGYHPHSGDFSVEHAPGGPLRYGLDASGAAALAARLGAPTDEARCLVKRARCASPDQVGHDRFATIRLCSACGHPTYGHDHTDCEF